MFLYLIVYSSVYQCLVQVGNGIELEVVVLQFELYRWRPCRVTWDSSRKVVVIELRQTSALSKGIRRWLRDQPDPRPSTLARPHLLKIHRRQPLCDAVENAC